VDVHHSRMDVNGSWGIRIQVHLRIVSKEHNNKKCAASTFQLLITPRYTFHMKLLIHEGMAMHRMPPALKAGKLTNHSHEESHTKGLHCQHTRMLPNVCWNMLTNYKRKRKACDVWVCPQVRHSAERFLVCQVGLSCFRLQTDKWVSKTYNFTIFPRTFGDEKKLFTCDVGSLGFLAEHKFDFNKMIYHGIPFMPLAQEERLLKVRLLVWESMLKPLLKWAHVLLCSAL
jgi:hypothetical protein